MEGMGSSSRLGGRSSSRYGSAPAVFTGPVRKWKKEWVHVTPRPPPNPKARKDSCRLLLCKWTPTAPSSTTAQPSRHRFRYAPVADVQISKADSKDKKNSGVTGEVTRADAEQGSMGDDVYEKLEMFEDSVRVTQPTLSSIFGEDDDDVIGGVAGCTEVVKQNKPTHLDPANSGRTWLTD